jgi:transposase
LPNRTAETLAAWLRRRPGIEIIARDRSTEYARGAALGTPKATQVADRWHLLLNARQMLERWLAGVHARLRQLPAMADAGGTARSARRTRAFPRSRAETTASADSRARWQMLYDEVRRRHAGGEPLLAIGRKMGLARGTVRKFAYAESFPERVPRAPGPSMLDPYLEHLSTRVAAGCENGLALWRELRGMGYLDTSRQVHRWLAERRTRPTRSRAGKGCSVTPTAADPSRAAARLPSPKQLAWLVVRSPGTLDPGDAGIVAHMLQDPEAAKVVAFARRFVRIVRRGCISEPGDRHEAVADLTAWLTEARTCGVPAVATFAAGLEQDGAAVRAALTLPWSSGQAEGQITKLKLLKRSMYGRASFDLLRRRVLLAA